MHCTRKITDDLIWIGANDRQHPIFEAAHPVPLTADHQTDRTFQVLPIHNPAIHIRTHKPEPFLL